MDGAFVIRGDGLVRTAGTFLCAKADKDQVPRLKKSELKIPEGLGTRHVAAATITAKTEATAIVISETDGNIRVFAGGEMVLKIDPTIEYGQVEEKEKNS